MSTVPTEYLTEQLQRQGYSGENLERALPPQEVWDFMGTIWDALFTWRWADHPELKEHTEALKWENLPMEQQAHYFYDCSSIVTELSDGIAHVIVDDLAEKMGIDPNAGDDPEPEGLNVDQMLSELKALGIDVLTEADLLGGDPQKGQFN
jgi:hypothetical protein